MPQEPRKLISVLFIRGFQRGLALDSYSKKAPSPMLMGTMQSCDASNRTKRWRKGEFSLFELDHLYSALHIRAPAFWIFKFAPSYATGFTGFPDYRWHIVGLLGLYNFMNSFSLALPLPFLLSLSLIPIGSVSLENQKNWGDVFTSKAIIKISWDTQRNPFAQLIYTNKKNRKKIVWDNGQVP